MVNSAKPAPVLEVSTRVAAAGERFDFFRDALCDVYLGIRPQSSETADFDADLLAHQWGDVVLSRMRAPGHEAIRDSRAIAAQPDDALFLNFSGNASVSVQSVDGVRAVRSATPVLLDNAEPFHLRFDPNRRFNLYSLRLPREIRGYRVSRGAVEKVNERMIQTRVGRQLALQTRMMTDEFDAGRVEVAGSMAETVTTLLAILLQGSEPGDALDRLTSYKATAITHLSEPGFTVHDLASVHHASIRTVQAEFSRSGTTFGAWIMRERLDLARERIEDPAWSQRSLEQIALASGIRDPSGFHRLFRTRFGEPPGAFRPSPRNAPPLPRGECWRA
jgi:AraC-like DNA-binding protein